MNTKDKSLEVLEEKVSSLLAEVGDFFQEVGSIEQFADYADKQDLIKHEIRKIENKELTLAVIATMKAGKSTFLNAIIGSKFLPYNDRPMTVIPTEVVLRKGIEKVSLTLSNELTIFLKNLVAEIKSRKQASINKFLTQAGYSHLTSFLDKLYRGQYDSIQPTLESKNHLEVLSYLTGINQIIRISIITGGSIENIPNIPRVEAPFYPFPGIPLSENIGSLVLIDTPGDNEALLTIEDIDKLVKNRPTKSKEDYFDKADRMKEALSSILRKQLDLASVTVSLVDYTSQGNKANIDIIRKLSETIGKRGPEQVFILLNKYDQKKKAEYSSGINEFKSDFHSRFAQHGFNVDKQIFPIAALHASEARNFFTTVKKYENEEQILRSSAHSQLIHTVFGDQDFLIDEYMMNPSLERATGFANRLWANSLMKDFLVEVINKLLKNAIPITLRSALEVTGKLLEGLSVETQIVNGVLHTEKEDLAERIRSLEGDLMKLELQRTKLGKINRRVKGLRESLESHIENYFSTINYVPIGIDKVFNKKNEIVTNEKGVRASVKGLFGKPKDARGIARELADSSEDELEKIADAVSKHLRSEFNRVSEDIFEILQEETEPIISELQRKLNKEFNLGIFLKPPKIDITAAYFDTDVSFKIREKTVDYWLYKSEHATLRKDDVVIEYQSKVRSLKRQFSDQIEESLNEKLSLAVEKYFKKLDKYIADYKEAFNKATKGNKLDLSAKKKLEAYLSDVIPKSDKYTKKANNLLSEVNKKMTR